MTRGTLTAYKRWELSFSHFRGELDLLLPAFLSFYPVPQGASSVLPLCGTLRNSHWHCLHAVKCNLREDDSKVDNCGSLSSPHASLLWRTRCLSEILRRLRLRATAPNIHPAPKLQGGWFKQASGCGAEARRAVAVVMEREPVRRQRVKSDPNGCAREDRKSLWWTDKRPWPTAAAPAAARRRAVHTANARS